MKNQVIKLFCLFILATTFSCKKAYDDNNLAPLAPSIADIPVTVSNYTYFERYPVFTATAPSGAFTITMSIPADKGKIKQISRITTGANGLRDVQTGAASLLYNSNGLAGTAAAAVPIPGNGSNTITFSSTLDAYKLYQARVGTGVASISPTVAANVLAPNQIEYYFMLTLEDGTNIIPTRVRVRVI